LERVSAAEIKSLEEDLPSRQLSELRWKNLSAAGCATWNDLRFYVNVSNKKYPNYWQEYDLATQFKLIDAFSAGLRFTDFMRKDWQGKTLHYELDLVEMQQVGKALTSSGNQAKRVIEVCFGDEVPPGTVQADTDSQAARAALRAAEQVLHQQKPAASVKGDWPAFALKASAKALPDTVIGYAKYVRDNCSDKDLALLKKVWLQYYSQDWRKLTVQREHQKVWTDLQSMMDDFVAGLQALHLEDLREDKYDYGLPFDILGFWTKEGEPHYWRHPLYYVLDKDQNEATKNLLWLINEENWNLPKIDDPPPQGDEELQSAVKYPHSSKADWKKSTPKSKSRAGKKQRDRAKHVKSEWYDKAKDEQTSPKAMPPKGRGSGSNWKSSGASSGSSWEHASSHQAGPSTTVPARQAVALLRVRP